MGVRLRVAVARRVARVAGCAATPRRERLSIARVEGRRRGPRRGAGHGLLAEVRLRLHVPGLHAHAHATGGGRGRVVVVVLHVAAAILLRLRLLRPCRAPRVRQVGLASRRPV